MQNADGTNRLTTALKNGIPTHFGYNHNGNITTIGTGYDITNTVYDRRNLPTAISKGSATFNYRYDHAGLRVYKQEGFNIHTLRGAFGEPLATYNNGSLAYWNILRPDGTVIGRRQGSNRLYYHRDLLGSTRTVVNASGNVEQTWDYYPFGLEMPGRSMPSGTTARERFTGHERDEEVGLDYMKARRYAAEFGRFLSVDPMADEYHGWSPYNYTLNNPIYYIDPTGLYPVGSDRPIENVIADFVYDPNTGKYHYDRDVTGPDNTPPGLVYVGPSLEDVRRHHEVNLYHNNILGFPDPGPQIDHDRSNYDIVEVGLQNNPLSWLMGGGGGIVRSLLSRLGFGRAAANTSTTILAGAVKSNYGRFVKSMPANAKSSASFKQLKDGNYLFEATSPGNVPGSKAVYQKWVNPQGETFKMIKTTYAPDGRIVHVKPKF